MIRHAEVAINTAVHNRRMSGAIRVTELTACALDASSITVHCYKPSRLYGRNSVLRALQWAAWDLVGFGLKARECGVLICPTNVAPLWRLPNQRRITMIHDVMVLDLGTFDRGFKFYASIVYRLAVSHTELVVTPSLYSAGRIRAVLKPSCPVQVLPYAARDSWFVKEPRPAVPASPRLAVIVVGAAEPHKRHDEAIAFASALGQRLGRRIKLNLVAARGRHERRIDRATKLHERYVDVKRWIGISDAQLRTLFMESALLLQFSVAEGFGLPVVEAAAMGVPVVHSGGGALQELLPSSALNVEWLGWELAIETAYGWLVDETSYAQASRRTLEEAQRYRQERFSQRIVQLLDDIDAF